MLKDKPVEARTRIKNNLTHILGRVRDTNHCNTGGGGVF